MQAASNMLADFTTHHKYLEPLVDVTVLAKSQRFQPIHFAVMEDHADIVEMLIDDYGVDVHTKPGEVTYFFCLYLCTYT